MTYQSDHSGKIYKQDDYSYHLAHSFHRFELALNFSLLAEIEYYEYELYKTSFDNMNQAEQAARYYWQLFTWS